jgi:hypothetical protein
MFSEAPSVDSVWSGAGCTSIQEDRKLTVHGHDELPHIRTSHQKADAAHAITVLKCKKYAFFIIGDDLMGWINANAPCDRFITVSRSYLQYDETYHKRERTSGVGAHDRVHPS